jgi:hypothetical protein
MPLERLGVTAAALLMAVYPVSAEKKWQGKLPHAPILGEGLAGTRVILGPISGRCAREFGDLLKQDLAAHGISVVTETELNSAVQQHHLKLAVPAGQGASPELAKVLGPTMIVSVEISRCQALPREPMVGPGLPAMHISRTEGHFLASLRVLDLSSGDELVTQTLRADPRKENESPTGTPEYPAPADLIDIGVRQAVGDTRRLYEPWTENQELTFMDDKDCNLRQAWELLKASDYRGLVKTSLANAESCQANPKAAAAAWYNLGVAYMLVQNYEGALLAFGKSGKLRDIRQSADLIAQCRTNKSLAEAFARHLVAWARQTQTEAPTGKAVRTGIVFTNDLVIRLVQGNVADEEIVKMIATQPNRFALGPDDLVRLKQAGVPEAILAAMQQGQ